MASGNALFLRITGRGGHAAAPHLTRDPVVVAAHIVTALQTIVARVVDPLQPAVVSVTAIHGGDAFNIIPEEVEMKVNFRAFSDEVAATIDTEIRRICDLTAASFATTVEVVDGMEVPYPATVNHPAETETALKVMRAIVGADRVDDAIKPMMASEDFSFILRQVPGCYLFIGNGDSAGLHNPAYDFNDAAIPYGVAFWSDLAAEVLPA
jgi:hippurate hydrolase